MTLRGATTAALVALLALGLPGAARAQPSRSEGARAQVEAVRKDPRFVFCKQPKRPLFARQHELCSLATEVPDCEGFAKACGDPAAENEAEKEPRSGVAEIFAAIARALVWVLVAAVIAAIAYPLIRALVRARRDRQLADRPPEPSVATQVAKAPAPEPERVTDAEAALREADDLARRGDLARALGLYLAASLAALDRRGAIRLARHRTNGEYVRSCAEDAAQVPLREIVREVDRAEFGKLPPTGEGVARVAARATALVRPLLLVLAALVLGGCSGRGFGAGPLANDPAGDELPMEILRRTGYAVSYLPSSLAALPMPTEGATAPIVVVDVAAVPLEEEAAAHLVRWVEGGGVLLLAGPAALWPAELHAASGHASTRALRVLTEDDVAQQAHVASSATLDWPGSQPIARLGTNVYGATKDVGQGAIVGLAGSELLTNIGTASPDNAEALVAIVDVAARERTRADAARGVTASPVTYAIHVARGHDGVPPPSNPFSALVQAGLGKGAWHALVAALVLFLAYGIRQGRARPATPPARRAFAEHVEATGAFYGRARAVAHALAAYGRFAEMRLRERVPRGADPVAFLAARAKVPHAEAARVWTRATEAKGTDPPRGDELATIRDLRALLVKALETG
ncbi:MAG TPA: DUF4350 domain-containing protein [Labilithrix sp.]|nr:DUF4350 domain-containing protein [Labilithrix sp.]